MNWKRWKSNIILIQLDRKTNIKWGVLISKNELGQETKSGNIRWIQFLIYYNLGEYPDMIIK